MIRVVLWIVVMLLSACSGGGGGTNSPVEPPGGGTPPLTTSPPAAGGTADAIFATRPIFVPRYFWSDACRLEHADRYWRIDLVC